MTTPSQSPRPSPLGRPRSGQRAGHEVPRAPRDEVTVLFARALEGDQVADLELGDRAFGPPGPSGSDPYALRAYVALRAVDIAELDRHGGPSEPELGIVEADQRDARARDEVLIAVALAAARDTHHHPEDQRPDNQPESGTGPGR